MANKPINRFEIQLLLGGGYIINRVWSDECVNLTVLPDCGEPVSKTSVPLLPEGTTSSSFYWRWPERV